MSLLTPDICVVGGGSGGLSVAAGAAQMGAETVLIERAKMGGDCLNYGCVPSKALLAAGKRAQALRTAGQFGIAASEPAVDMAKVRAHVRGVIDAIAPMDSAERFRGLGVRVIKGTARFIDKRTVVVDSDKDLEIRARRFVIATGSRPSIPSIAGLDGVPYFTNETVFDLDVLPRHLLVIGAGAVGLELAQAFRRLGSAVTVLEAAVPLAKDDPEGAAIVLATLAREGVVIRSGVTVTQVARANGGVAVTMTAGEGSETLAGSHLLVAAGRTPVVDDLGLEAARIRHDARGIAVNKKLKTSNRRVYAVGDVTGGAQFTHAANHHASLVIRNALFRLPIRFDPHAIPWVTYTDPELAHIGLTEAEAARRGGKIRVLRWAYHDNDRAQAERGTTGHVKVTCTSKGRILGVTIVGAAAGELLMPWILAVAEGLNIRAFIGLVVPYPTVSEIAKRAAIDFFAPRLTGPWVRRMIRWLRMLG